MVIGVVGGVRFTAAGTAVRHTMLGYFVEKRSTDDEGFLTNVERKKKKKEIVDDSRS